MCRTAGCFAPGAKKKKTQGEEKSVKIDVGNGTPVWLSPRQRNGVTVQQGTSRIMLSAAEIPLLIQAIQAMTSETAVFTPPEAP